MHETLCTVTGGRGGVCMYVCARDGMHVWLISISASLTSFVAAMSAPFCNSREQISLWPFQAV